MTASPTRQSLVRASDDGPRRWFFGGGLHIWKATAEETDGAFILFEDRMDHGKQVLESFRSDKFDATAVAPPPEKVRERATAGTTRFLGVAEKVLPILTPDQRKIAAE